MQNAKIATKENYGGWKNEWYVCMNFKKKLLTACVCMHVTEKETTYNYTKTDLTLVEKLNIVFTRATMLRTLGIEWTTSLWRENCDLKTFSENYFLTCVEYVNLLINKR